ncbi:HEAT repeat domain-containing protein [Natroniella sulfidigena]|uniref:HEAT repeat domain-containing protein n=1 Tax=Natroniella sulfidigena TaxID=723921 RepID=UPI00200B2A1C|nr:HEAT repeat domain-containing protein [Natroniella sulfidigena]MCK8817324.1 HEAT repeat domain-containing protein [Natroniella sulfidigena]
MIKNNDKQKGVVKISFYLQLLAEDYNYLLLVAGGIVIIISLLLLLKKKKTTESNDIDKDYKNLIHLIETDFKQALNKLDQIEDIEFKEELILKGKKDLKKNSYRQIKSYFVNHAFLKELLEETFAQDVERRKKAAFVLLEIGTTQAIDYLIPLLYDEESEIRNLVIQNLSKLDNPKVITTLINYLDSCDDLATLNVLKESFLELGSVSVSQLLTLLKSRDKSYLNWVVEILGDIGDKQAIDPLINLLYQHPDPQIRVMAAKSLAKFEDEKVFKALLHKIEDDNCNVRAQIAKLLGEFDQKEVIPYLCKMLTDDSGIVRNNACQSLLKSGDEGIKYLILAIETNDLKPDVINKVRGLDSLKLLKVAKEIYQTSNNDETNKLKLIKQKQEQEDEEQEELTG